MVTPLAPFGEIIESSLKTIKVLCWDAHNLPSFGQIISFSFNNLRAYGIITEMVTESIDSQRTPFAFKKTPDELQREQPQIFLFIQTVCTVVIVWHERQSFPREINTLSLPSPAPLHTWAHFCKTIISNRFLLETLSDRLAPEIMDDCVITLVTLAIQHNKIEKKELFEFVESYSQGLNHSLKRAQRFLQNIEQLITHKNN